MLQGTAVIQRLFEGMFDFSFALFSVIGALVVSLYCVHLVVESQICGPLLFSFFTFSCLKFFNLM